MGFIGGKMDLKYGGEWGKVLEGMIWGENSKLKTQKSKPQLKSKNLMHKEDCP